jgi:hypothetical protein
MLVIIRVLREKPWHGCQNSSLSFRSLVEYRKLPNFPEITKFFSDLKEGSETLPDNAKGKIRMFLKTNFEVRMKKVAIGFSLMGVGCLVILFIALATRKLPLMPKGPAMPWFLLWTGLAMTVLGLVLYSYAEDNPRPKKKRAN